MSTSAVKNVVGKKVPTDGTKTFVKPEMEPSSTGTVPAKGPSSTVSVPAKRPPSTGTVPAKRPVGSGPSFKIPSAPHPKTSDALMVSKTTTTKPLPAEEKKVKKNDPIKPLPKTLPVVKPSSKPIIKKISKPAYPIILQMTKTTVFKVIMDCLKDFMV
jgi:hypothetical protein